MGDILKYIDERRIVMSDFPAVKQVKVVVTPDDFKNKFGKDLAYMLEGSDNDSNFPSLFLRLVQEYLMDWCDVAGFRVIKFNELNPQQLAAFQNAVLYQTYYTWTNGPLGLGLESGVDTERGRLLSVDDIRATEVAPRVIVLLKRAGLFNLKMKNRPRINRGYPGVFGLFTGEDY